MNWWGPAAGWVLAAFALIQVPAWAVWAVYRQKQTGLSWMQVHLPSLIQFNLIYLNEK